MDVAKFLFHLRTYYWRKEYKFFRRSVRDREYADYAEFLSYIVLFISSFILMGHLLRKPQHKIILFGALRKATAIRSAFRKFANLSSQVPSEYLKEIFLIKNHTNPVFFFGSWQMIAQFFFYDVLEIY